MLNIFSLKRKEVFLDDREVLEKLGNLFPRQVVTSETTIEEVMMEAGRREVIDFIERKLR